MIKRKKKLSKMAPITVFQLRQVLKKKNAKPILAGAVMAELIDRLVYLEEVIKEELD